MPPRKGASKAEGASTSAVPPSKKSVTKPAAPKSTARKAATPKAQKKDATSKATSSPQASESSNRPMLTPTSLKKTDKKKAATPKATSATSKKSTKSGVVPSTKKSQKKSSKANATATPAPEPAAGPSDRPSLPDQIAPEPQVPVKAATAKAKKSSSSKATEANTSRKRRSSSIEDDEVAPVATRTARKKIKPDSGSSKRKATADAGKRVRKARRLDDQDEHDGADVQDDQALDAVEPVKPRRKAAATKAAASAKKPAASKAGQVKKGVRKEVKREAKKEAPVKFQTRVQINFAPTDSLDVFTFGSGESGELGLGNKRIDGKKPVNVKRPRLHPLLLAEDVGVVQIACGGMHSVALTKDNKILTWGVNDQGALGRDTTWDGGLREADAEDAEDNVNSFEALNPLECTPTEVNTENIAEGTKFTKVVASDSASFALTEDGRVYGWGTFRSSDGILGFTKDILVQYEPMLLPDSKRIVDIATGNNHVMTLDSKGKVETWGAAEMNQLGRRVVQRDMTASALRPGGLSFKRGIKIAKIACGSYHSFAIDDLGRLYAWGLNNYGELGLFNETVGEDGSTVLEPTLVESLADYSIGEIAGGEHHSVACSEDGKLLVWGRIDGKQTGLTADKFSPANTIYDEHDAPRILTAPTVHEGIDNVVSVACGIDNSFAITRDGKAYSWGFSANYQTGQGDLEDDVEVPTLIDNSAIRDRKIVSAGAGGQFSVLTSIHQDA